MAVFAYKATDADASMLSGTILADTPRQARDLLRAKGLRVQQVNERSTERQLSWLQRRLAKRHGQKLLSFVRELATLLSVGIPLLEAIDTVSRQHTGSFRACLLALRDRVSAGASLADAMREQPLVFDELCVNIVDVGESSGTLDGVLERLAEFRERASQLKSRVGTALLYPCIVVVMGIAVSIFLMSFVVPNLLSALVQAGKPLPLATQMVKAASDFLVYRWWVLILIVAGCVLSAAVVLRSSRGRHLWHRLQLRLPVIGDMVRKQAVVRIAVVVSTLLKSGIVFVKAVQIAQRSTRNVVLKDALERFEKAVYGGQDIAQALE
jgi:type II secretory pathway component PulF